MRGLRAVFFAALMLCAGGLSAHFLLNINIRVIHAVHESDGLRLLVRLPMPYLVADKLGAVDDATGLPGAAPYTYNARDDDGALLHYFDADAFTARPLGLGEILADGLTLKIDARELQATVENVRAWRAERQPPFANLSEARRAFALPFAAEEVAQNFVGDTVIDVELAYPTGGKVAAYELASKLNPGLPQQEQTANVIIDHGDGAQEPLVYRVRGLMLQPLAVSRSALKAAWTFLQEGVRHILEGRDHVLFVLCLLLGALTFGALAWRITGFTVGHSVTLALGFFGYAPGGAWFVPLVETGIALSIIYVAVDALTPKQQRGMTWITALLGLLHGLGFSFVLKEILKVDAPNVWQSLLAFNLGVEVGQLLLAALIWPLLWWVATKRPQYRRAMNWVIALPCIGVAGVWVGERSLQLVGSF